MEINATFVEPSICGLDVLDAQSRRICVVVEVGLLVEDVLIGPGHGLVERTSPRIKAVVVRPEES